MMEHLSGDLIDRYLARTLAPADILALHSHAEACPDCRSRLEAASLARIPAVGGLFPGGAGDPHLTEDEMVAFVVRRLPEPRRAEAARHLKACEACLDSVQAMESERGRRVFELVGRPVVRRFAVGAIAAAWLVAVLAGEWRIHHGVTPPPVIVASLRDGNRTIALDANGVLRGQVGASPEERILVRDALQRKSLPVGPELSAAKPGVLLGPGGAAQPVFSLTAPINTRVCWTSLPVFSWQAYSGATAYQVVVTSESLDPLARSGRITATQWQPETRLPRGATLLWQVRAWRGGEMVSAPAPPAPPARFEIAGEQIALRLEQLRSSPLPHHLLAAVLCARAGLREEAAAELDVLARENPGSALIQSLHGR